jgi:FixJ family two-component response regulator
MHAARRVTEQERRDAMEQRMDRWTFASSVSRLSSVRDGTMQTEPIVFVVDDDDSMRQGLASLIASAGLQVECFTSAQEFLLHRLPERPSCLVLDVRMPGPSGLDLQRVLSVAGRRLPIVFITAHDDVSMAVRAMKAGAVEFLPKPCRSEDLLHAVYQALQTDRLTRERQREVGIVQRRRNTLTVRERQVLDQIYSGRLNKQIAATLGVSENTIKAHRRHIMKKMGATTSAALLLMIQRLV